MSKKSSKCQHVAPLTVGCNVHSNYKLQIIAVHALTIDSGRVEKDWNALPWCD